MFVRKLFFRLRSKGRNRHSPIRPSQAARPTREPSRPGPRPEAVYSAAVTFSELAMMPPIFAVRSAVATTPTTSNAPPIQASAKD